MTLFVRSSSVSATCSSSWVCLSLSSDYGVDDFLKYWLIAGYDTQLAIVEPVLRSVHDRAPDTISAHAGFYGWVHVFFEEKNYDKYSNCRAGMCTVFFMLASLVSPCVLGILGSKVGYFRHYVSRKSSKFLWLSQLQYTLVLGSLLFTIHLASFQYIHYLSYYITSAAIGVGYAREC